MFIYHRLPPLFSTSVYFFYLCTVAVTPFQTITSISVGSLPLDSLPHLDVNKTHPTKNRRMENGVCCFNWKFMWDTKLRNRAKTHVCAFVCFTVGFWLWPYYTVGYCCALPLHGFEYMPHICMCTRVFITMVWIQFHSILPDHICYSHTHTHTMCVVEWTCEPEWMTKYSTRSKKKKKAAETRPNAWLCMEKMWYSNVWEIVWSEFSVWI